MTPLRARLISAQQAKAWLDSAYVQLKPHLLSERAFDVVIKPATRTLDQNAAQWPILQSFADQLPWPVNGVMSQLSPEEFKDIFSAAFHQENVRVAAGLNGGLVMLGKRTSQMSRREFSEWLDFLHATAADRGVILEVNHETA
jgi:hypothetical protein